MSARLTLAGLGAGLLLTGAGCGLCRKGCRDARPRFTPSPAPTRPGVFLDDPVPPVRGGGIPPPNVPTTPGGGVDPLPPPLIPDSRGSFRLDPATPPGPWDPVPSRSAFRPNPPPAGPLPKSRTGAELLLPESPSNGSSPPPTIDLPSGRRPTTAGFLEEPVRPYGGSDLPPRLGDERAAPPPTAADRPAPSQRPAPPSTAAVPGSAELPGFQAVQGKDGVATGGRPSAYGFEWLKQRGYRTVVYLHGPSEGVSAARDLAAKHGLRFVPIAVTPGSLQPAYADFAAMIRDTAARPMYVADADGRRAGVMWYLLFRNADLVGDDAARVRAGKLGLSDPPAGEQKQLWDAAQDVR